MKARTLYVSKAFSEQRLVPERSLPTGSRVHVKMTHPSYYSKMVFTWSVKKK